MPKKRMINASRQGGALRVDRAAWLRIVSSRRDGAVGSRRRTTRRKRKNLKPGGVRIVTAAVEMNADKNGVEGGVGNLRSHFQRHEIIPFASHDHFESFRLQNRAELSHYIE